MPAVPGKGGRVPKPSSQVRDRREKDHGSVIKVESSGVGVPAPKLVGRHPAVARRFYEAVVASPQSAYYTAADWAALELLVLNIEAYLLDPTNASLMRTIQSGMASLLITAGDRLRARLEIERAAGKTDPAEEAADREIAAFLEGAAAAQAQLSED